MITATTDSPATATSFVKKSGRGTNPSVMKKTKRYNLVLPEKLFTEVEQVASKNEMKVVDVIRRFIKLGLVISSVEDDPDAIFLIRQGDREREITFI